MVLASSNTGPLFFQPITDHTSVNASIDSAQVTQSVLNSKVEELNNKNFETIDDVKELNTELSCLNTQLEGIENGQIQSELSVQRESNLEIQQLVRDILRIFSSNLEGKMKETMKKVEALQKDMASLQKLLGKINDLTDEKTGQLEIKDAELKELLEQAKVLGLDFDDQEGKPLTKYERDNLVEKIKNLTTDLNTEFSLLSKKADRLNSERTEFLKYAHMILKTLHDIYMKFARLIKGSQ